MSKRDYYEVLGVQRTADEAELKQAYRAIALRDHPDRNPDDPEAEERFKEASEAYAVLSEPQKRQAYDQFGFGSVPGAGGPGGGFDFAEFGSFGDAFNDLFGDLFGARQGQRRTRGQRGADLRYNLEIELTDVLVGRNVQIKLPKMRICGTCSGSGTRPGTSPETCERCRGSGQMVLQQGFFRISRPCDACGGVGEVVRSRCSECRGSGRLEGEQTLEVRVPPGVDDGTRLRLSGEGEAGVSGGPPGDLYVVLSARRHPLFERSGSDLVCQVPISFVQAALGDEIEAPTLEGVVSLKIPAATQSGKTFRLRGKGLPSLRSAARGDQIVEIFVETPSKLTRRQRELLEEFAAEGGHDVSPVTKGFMDKLRELFD